MSTHPPNSPRPRRYLLYVSALVLTAVLVSAGSALAQVPGINGKIVFETNRDGDFDIYTMGKNGSNQVVRAPSSFADQGPGWSPDGRQIAFSSERDGGGNFDVWVMRANGGNLRRVSNIGGDEFQLDWSPDGKSIAVQSNQDGDSDIYLMDLASGKRTKLTFNNLFDGQPVFSPDGSKIAFEREKTPGDLSSFEIFVMDVDGSNVKNLTNTPGLDVSPAWSPDGKYITFATDRHGDGGDDPAGIDLADNWEIYRMDAATGANQIRLTNNPALENKSHWSPDGKKIVFDSRRDGGDFDIFVMNANGSNVKQLTANNADDQYPRWQPVPHKCRGVAATIVGTVGNDVINGTNGRDVIVGLAGADTINGRGGNDLICLGGGADIGRGGSGADTIFGQGGNDNMRGGSGADRLIGGAGRDIANGGRGPDTCLSAEVRRSC